MTRATTPTPTSESRGRKGSGILSRIPSNPSPAAEGRGEFGSCCRINDGGHGGVDFVVIKECFNAVGNATASPIDAYDAAARSCIVPLSAESIRRGSARAEIPDFTGGRVKLAPAAAG